MKNKGDWKTMSQMLEQAADPVRNAKFYAKGAMISFKRRNPKAGKKKKLAFWRETYLTNLFKEQKRHKPKK